MISPRPLPKDRQAWAETMLDLARFGLGFYFLLAPFGTTFREIGGITATVAVVLYYVLDWQGSVLRLHPLRWIFAAFLGVLVLKTLHSAHPSLSWYALSHSLYSTLFLGVAGLESIRSWRHVRLLLWCAALAACAEGVVGIKQAVTGRASGVAQDYLNSGRLTGTMDSPRVGNLLSLLLPLAIAAPFVNPSLRLKPRNTWKNAVICALLATPALFLLVFSKTRSGWIGFAVAFFVLVLLRFGRRPALLLLLAAVLGGMLDMPDNLTWAAVTADQRWTIWGAALDIFLAHPLLGTGIDTFGDARVAMGITFNFDYMAHPHNIYLQALAETGILGFAAQLAFLFGSLAVMVLPLWRRRSLRPDTRFLMAAAPAAAWAGYLATAFSAHSFYRTWWLGMALAVQGLGLACARLLDEDQPS